MESWKRRPLTNTKSPTEAVPVWIGWEDELLDFMGGWVGGWVGLPTCLYVEGSKNHDSGETSGEDGVLAGVEEGKGSLCLVWSGWVGRGGGGERGGLNEVLDAMGWVGLGGVGGWVTDLESCFLVLLERGVISVCLVLLVVEVLDGFIVEEGVDLMGGWVGGWVGGWRRTRRFE